MPKYYEEKEEDGRACGGVREDLKQCLLESPCVLQVRAGATPRLHRSAVVAGHLWGCGGRGALAEPRVCLQRGVPVALSWGRSLGDLILLLLIRQENKSPRQCLREGHCKGLQLTFFACKRSMVSAHVCVGFLLVVCCFQVLLSVLQRKKSL